MPRLFTELTPRFVEHSETQDGENGVLCAQNAPFNASRARVLAAYKQT